jgi:hypothetical protein
MNIVGPIALAAGLLLSGATSADDFSGTRLYEFCNHHDGHTEETTCAAFVHGLLDGLMLGSMGRYCPPKEGVSVAQGRLIIEKFMRDHPEALHKQAGIMAGVALATAFPCPNPKTSN